MNHAFFGTPEFSAIILERLIGAGFPPDLVITNPDRPVGRKKILTPPPVKLAAEKYRLPIWQPESLKTQNPAQGGVFDSSWDFFLVAAYGKIIPKNILAIPRLGVINIHPSLLPKHRGPTPIQTAILNGDAETGVSLMLLDEEVDHGPILAQNKWQITEDMTAIALTLKLAELGAELLIQTLPKFLKGELKPIPQDHAKATFTKKFTLDDAFVKYDDLTTAISGATPDKAIRINRTIRALNPEPGAWTQTPDFPIFNLPKNKRVRLLEAEIIDDKLKLKKIQVDGKKPYQLQ